MKSRIFLIAAAVIVVLGAAAALATPFLAQKIAEREVDKALKQIRKQSTSVVNRGPVSVNLRTWTVTVADVSIQAPGALSTVTIGSIAIVNPDKDRDDLTADRVLFEGVRIASGGETIVVPTIDVVQYSGPARGLVTTPGVGRMARSQSEVIAQISLAGVKAPSIEIRDEGSGIRRAIHNVTVGRIEKGVVDRAAAESVTLTAPQLSDSNPETDDGIDLTTGEVVYQGLNLPTLWRFYASDGAGEREPLAESVTASRVAARFAVKPTGRIQVTADRLEVAGVRIRPLSYPTAELDELARLTRRTEPPTPADIRRRLLVLADGVRALAFERVAVSGATVEASAGPERRTLRAQVASVEAGPYQDARLDRLSIGGLALADGNGGRAALAHAAATKFDANGLVTYAEKVGRDETLLSFEPTAEDVVRIAPRLAGVEIGQADVSAAGAEIKLDQGRLDFDAPADVVPQRIAARLDGLNMTPPPGGWAANALQTVALDGLRGSAKVAVTLDPSTKTLSVDAFDYDFEDLGHVTAKGELAEVDPLLAMSTGASFIERLSAVLLQPFSFTLRNEGVIDTLMRRAAAKAGQPVELYRESTARDAQDMVARLFGPPATDSAQSLADFVRDPRTLAVTILPKSQETRLIDVLQSLPLGPAGIAQTVDVTILYKR
jgi:hypothetical protein